MRGKDVAALLQAVTLCVHEGDDSGTELLDFGLPREPSILGGEPHLQAKTLYSPLPVSPPKTFLDNKDVVVFTVKWPKRAWHACSRLGYVVYRIG
jgi:hypothetical protein